MAKEKRTRVTKKWLTEWLNKKLEELEVPFVVENIHITNYRGYDYEAGASKLNFYLESKEGKYNSMIFLCTYSMKELTYLLNGDVGFGNPKGIKHKLVIEPANRFTLNDSYVAVKII
jgi:hypothetical protein